tara:strand:+ start:2127 stop:3428 length:1302 start_codon:yes stop_codon:yes gene_type:complete
MEECEARSYAPSDLLRILVKARELCPGDAAFLDIGCGNGNVLQAAQDLVLSPVVGIDNKVVCLDDAAAAVPDAKLINQDLTTMDEDNRAEIVAKCETKATIAHCYDGGILPLGVVESACILVGDLPANSVVVFVTNITPGKYDCDHIVDLMEEVEYNFIGALHDVKETEDSEVATMHALYFSRELDLTPDGLKPNYQKEDDLVNEGLDQEYFVTEPWAWFESAAGGQPLGSIHTVQPNGSCDTQLPEQFSQITVRVATDAVEAPDLFHVKPSTIKGAGSGLFAARFLAEGTIITEFMGDEMAAVHVDDDAAEYAMTNSSGISRVPDARTSWRFAHFMNMADDEDAENCEVLDEVEWPGSGWMVAVVKDIYADDEIFLNYRRAGNVFALESSVGDVVNVPTARPKRPGDGSPQGRQKFQKVLTRFRSLHLQSAP